MSIISVGTPTAATGTASPVTGTFGAGQNRVAGNLLVAVVVFNATTSAAATAQNAGTTGWVNRIEIGSTATALARLAIWTKVATGGDAAPAFSSVTSGTVQSSCTLYELSGVNANITFTDATGTATATAATVAAQTVTSSGNVTLPGEFAIAGFARERASIVSTITATGGFTLDTSNTGVTSIGHSASMSFSGPFSGSAVAATVNYSGTSTTSAAAAGIITFIAATSGPPVGPDPGPSGQRVIYLRAGWTSAPAQVAAAPAPPPVPTSGPAFFPARQVIRARIYPNFPRAGVITAEGGLGTGNVSAPLNGAGFGSGIGNNGSPVRNPTAGPVFYPLTRPCRAVIPQALPGQVNAELSPGTGNISGPVRSGRGMGASGALVRNPSQGPSFAQRPAPVRYRIPPWMPRAGRIGSAPGGPVINPQRGPPFTARNWPVQAQDPPPRKGRVYASPAQPVPPVPPPPPSRPAAQALRVRQPLQSRGRVYGISQGTFTPSTGPRFTPVPRPVRAPVPQTFSRGRISSSPGAPVRNPQPGPRFIPVRNPVQARQPLPSKGRAYGISPGTLRNPSQGPPFAPFRSPVQARNPLPRRGLATGISQGGPARNPAAGPAFTPFRRPVQARFPLPPRGRASSNPGGPVQNPVPGITGPPFFPFRQAVHIRFALPPKGRTAGSQGSPARNPLQGPSFRQAAHPVQARLPLPSRGRVASGQGFRSPQTGPAFRPLVQALRARLPVPLLTGRTSSDPGAPVRNPGQGPSFAQQPRPVQARIPQAWSKGRASSSPGAPVRNPPGQGPGFTPLTHPVQARQPLPARGRTGSNPGAVTRLLVPARFTPRHDPARVRPSLPPRGRSAGVTGSAPRNPQRGPGFAQAVRPVRAVIPQNAPRGRTSSDPGSPVQNIPLSRAVFKLGLLFTPWDAGQPLTGWEADLPVVTWNQDDLTENWEAGQLTADWTPPGDLSS